MQFTFVCRLTREPVEPVEPNRLNGHTGITGITGLTGSTVSTDLATADQQHKLHRIPVFENSL
jgi:hypothetical protein